MFYYRDIVTLTKNGTFTSWGTYEAAHDYAMNNPDVVRIEYRNSAGHQVYQERDDNWTTHVMCGVEMI